MGNLIFTFLLLSLFAFIVLGVLLIIRLIFKKGMATKRILMFMGTSFVIFLLSFIILPPSENGSSEANESEVEEFDESVEVSTSNDEDVESKTEDKEDESIDNEKSDDKQAEDENIEKKNKKETVQEDGTEVEEETVNDDSDSEVYLNVYEAAEKSLDEVSELLGEGKKVDEGKFDSFGVSYPSETYVYDDESIEILFVDGVAARITLTPQEDVSFNDEDAREAFLRQYGFPFWSSSEETERAILWESVGSVTDGLYQVTMFNNGEGNINYVYVITDQKYK